MVADAGGGSLIGRLGWAVVLVAGALLGVYGVFWLFVGPEMALENIAERTTLAPDAFRQGSPSAFDVITIVTRQGAAFGAAMGLLAVIVAWQGYRHAAGWAWWASWATVLGIATTGVAFLMVSSAAAQGYFYLGAAGIVAIALIAARSALAR